MQHSRFIKKKDEKTKNGLSHLPVNFAVPVPCTAFEGFLHNYQPGLHVAEYKAPALKASRVPLVSVLALVTDGAEQTLVESGLLKDTAIQPIANYQGRLMHVAKDLHELRDCICCTPRLYLESQPAPEPGLLGVIRRPKESGRTSAHMGFLQRPI